MAVVVTTVLDSMEGVIIDLSEGGAQVMGCSLPERTQCQLEYEGQVVFGTVQWSEEDRIGIRFPYELTEGPLYDRLEMTRAARRTPGAFAPHGLGTGGFGRRVS
jgi:hypothetical protein